ncbi:hypothetical protein RCL_jg5304.t1 [Rhizophagus clarus]|uniref:Uncharacterized protein n=1 Tax=Rhizophagus clarus TaxID=94130 RepID=A0A8H3LMB9_9GLOM|nr:hypothetical protein RCL_jg5304.t1 [Rhizophagus clarus]
MYRGSAARSGTKKKKSIKRHPNPQGALLVPLFATFSFLLLDFLGPRHCGFAVSQNEMNSFYLVLLISF